MVSELHKVIFNSKLQITMSELSAASGVSPSQIRYWEKKGYIQSIQEQKNQSHKYVWDTLGTVMGIKFYLDKGYTLAAAYEQQHQQRLLLDGVKRFTQNRVQDVKLVDETVEIDLGTLEGCDHQRVIAQVTPDGQTTMMLRNVEEI